VNISSSCPEQHGCIQARAVGMGETNQRWGCLQCWTLYAEQYESCGCSLFL